LPPFRSRSGLTPLTHLTRGCPRAFKYPERI